MAQTYPTRPVVIVVPFADRNHDAIMRIGGEAPGRRAHSAIACPKNRNLK
jgi:hypothetical protein